MKNECSMDSLSYDHEINRLYRNMSIKTRQKFIEKDVIIIVKDKESKF